MPVDVAEDAQGMAAALTAVRVAGDARERLARLDALLAALKSLTVRDVEPDQPLFDALFTLLAAGWRGSLGSEAARSVDVLATGLLALPEFAVGGIGVSDALLDACFDQMLLPEPTAPVTGGGGPRGSSSAQLPGGVSLVAGSTPPAERGGAPACADAAAGGAPACVESLASRLSCARAVLDWCYRHQQDLRPALRGRIGRTLLAAVGGVGPPPPGLRSLLQSLTLITAGFGAPTGAHRALLLSVLVPLHRPAGRLDETTPHLSLFHEPLVHNLLLLLKRQPSLLLPTVSGLLQLWPAPQDGNSGKEVLMLHELEQLVELTPAQDARRLSLTMAPLIARAVGSDNSRLAERALALFASPPVRSVLLADSRGALPLLLSSLTRSFTPHWNRTVNKMTCEVLSLLQQHDPPAFAAAAEELFAPGPHPTPACLAAPAAYTAGGAHPRPAPPPGYVPMQAPWATAGARGGRQASRQSPSGCGAGGGAQASRLSSCGARGVMGARGGAVPRLGPISRMQADLAPRDPNLAHRDANLPPQDPNLPPRDANLARPGPPPPAAAPVHSASSPPATPPPPAARPPPVFELQLDQVDRAAARAMAAAAEEEEEEEEAWVGEARAAAVEHATGAREATRAPPPAPGGTVSAAAPGVIPSPPGGIPSPPSGPGLSRVLAYMRSIQPREACGAAPSAETREHLTEAPTMLPHVIFQDLVFGHELGVGAFSTVRYCKRVVRGLSASTWPEYAAKVIGQQLMRELGYETSVRREIAILRQLRHVSVARLVASFRWRSDVYLLLEYAARGDLHSTLRRVGSLATLNTRFIAAQVCVGLGHIHSAGYAFGDLKPENILLTASGHAKLTDFGGARPLPGHHIAKQAVATARNVIQELRDGDWTARRRGQAHPNTGGGGGAAADTGGGGGAAANTGGGGCTDANTGGGGGPDANTGGGGGTDANTGGGGGAAAGGPPCCMDSEVGMGPAEEGEGEEDSRLEGTAAYLSPERVQGASPSVSSDCWALGCVVYQCLCGKPPLWASSQAETLRSIVRFQSLDAQHDAFPPSLPDTARALVTELLTPDPAVRLGASGVGAVLAHPFFAGIGDAELLYSQQPPPLAQGPAPPAPNAAWARRQNSMLWSPLPQRYAFAEAGTEAAPVAHAIDETDIEAHAPFAPGLGTWQEHRGRAATPGSV